jgi:hypothetical protein
MEPLNAVKKSIEAIAQRCFREGHASRQIGPSCHTLDPACHRSFRDVETQLEQPAVDAWSSPDTGGTYQISLIRGVELGHAANQTPAALDRLSRRKALFDLQNAIPVRCPAKPKQGVR